MNLDLPALATGLAALLTAGASWRSKATGALEAAKAYTDEKVAAADKALRAHVAEEVAKVLTRIDALTSGSGQYPSVRELERLAALVERLRADHDAHVEAMTEAAERRAAYEIDVREKLARIAGAEDERGKRRSRGGG